MKILITGTPGTGKTALAEKLGKRLKWRVTNEKKFALKTKTGKQTFRKSNFSKKLHQNFDQPFSKRLSLIKSSSQANAEVEIDAKKFKKKMNEFLKEKNNVIIEGHLLCEMKINADLVFLLRAKREILEKRLRKKGYGEVKIQDNLFCEENGYCKKKCLKNYKKVIEIKNEKTLNSSMQKIIKIIRKKRKRKRGKKRKKN